MKYKVLEHFSPEARAAAASRVYDQMGHGPHGPGPNKTWGGYTCKDGRCLFAVLIHHENPEWWANNGYEGEDQVRPAPEVIVHYLEDRTLENEIEEIVNLNDRGLLATPEQVAALFAEEG